MLAIALSEFNYLMSLKTLRICSITIELTDVPSGKAMKAHHYFFFDDKTLTSK